MKSPRSLQTSWESWTPKSLVWDGLVILLLVTVVLMWLLPSRDPVGCEGGAVLEVLQYTTGRWLYILRWFVRKHTLYK